MRVLMITAQYPPAVGGAATYFSDIAPRIAERKEIDALVVLTEKMPGAPGETTTGKLHILRRLPTRASMPRRPFAFHAWSYLMTQLWFYRHLEPIVRRQAIDLVHFHTRYRGRLFYKALDQTNLPVVGDLRDKMAAPQKMVGVVDRLLCCGEGVVQFASAQGFPLERIAQIPIPFELKETPTPSEIREICSLHNLTPGKFLLFVGDMTFNKGVYDLLDASDIWRRTHDDIPLILAGPNREGKRFLDRVASSAGATYLGRVSHPEALALISAAAMLILPSRSEGLPRVILEAVALETKVIAPPGVPEFDRHLHAAVLPEVTKAALVKKLTDTWHAARSATYPLEEHHVERVVQKTVALYKKAIHPHPAQRLHPQKK